MSLTLGKPLPPSPRSCPGWSVRQSWDDFHYMTFILSEDVLKSLLIVTIWGSFSRNTLIDFDCFFPPLSPSLSGAQAKPAFSSYFKKISLIKELGLLTSKINHKILWVGVIQSSHETPETVHVLVCLKHSHNDTKTTHDLNNQRQGKLLIQDFLTPSKPWFYHICSTLSAILFLLGWHPNGMF